MISSNALKALSIKTLDVKMNYPEGVMSRREWIMLMRTRGACVKTSTRNRVDFNRVKYNRMNSAEQDEYEKKCNEKVPCFNLVLADGSFYHITRAEYDYFNTLQEVTDEA
jgi:hypothetical protein